MDDSSKPDQPDLCIAVDFGTTYTGVAWISSKIEDQAIHIFRDWPEADPREPKVPTLLAMDQTGEATDWGFPCKRAATKKWRGFKIFLDPDELTMGHRSGSYHAPKDSSEVDRIVTEYLSHVYRHISVKIPNDATRASLPGKGWKDWKVCFIFSVPTTWRPEQINHFRQLVWNAGFGQVDQHKVVLGLTEAEAAAVAAGNSDLSIQKGDVLLTVDAGGGTTDFAFVKAAAAKPLTLESLEAEKGVARGSLTIDTEFERLPCRNLPGNVAQKVTESNGFRMMKHNFGQRAHQAPGYSLPVSKDMGDCSFGMFTLKDGQLFVKHEIMQDIFDDILMRIAPKRLDALEKFGGSYPDNVKYVVLSGGLGGSAYVLRNFEEFFAKEREKRECVHNTTVISCHQPQLAVLRGLLMNWQHDTLRTRTSRLSYGIVVQQLYSKKSYFSQSKTKDPSNGKEYVTDQIQWLIKKGTRLTVGDEFGHTIEKRLGSNDADQEGWSEKIVWSENHEKYLPENLTQPGVYLLREISVSLAESGSLKKMRPIFRKKYYVCQYRLSLTVGKSGGLEFTVSPESGLAIDDDNEPIKVESEIEDHAG